MEAVEMSGENGGMYLENSDSFLIHFLHSFPHIDFSLTVVNSTFDLESTKYKESLLFWASLPVLGLLIVLISLLAYLIFRCICKSAYDDEPTNRSRMSESECEKTNKCISCVKWSISCLVLLACGSSAFGFYGNNEIRKGSNIVSDAIASTAINLYYAQTQVSQLRSLINSTNAEIKSLRETLKRHFGQYRHLNTTANDELGKHLELMSRRMTEVWNHVRDLVDRDEKRDETDSKVAIYSKLFEDFDLYRWITCISVFIWLIVLSLLLLLGAVKSSKCLLLIFCTCGILTLVVCWLSCSLHLALILGLSDFCFKPDVSSVKEISKYYDSRFTEYYIKCKPAKHPNPLVHHIKGAQNGVSEMNSNINEAANYIKNFLPQSESSYLASSIQTSVESINICLAKLIALSECSTLNKIYKHSIHGMCHIALPGYTDITLLSFAFGIILALLVFFSIKLWRLTTSFPNGSIIKERDTLMSHSFHQTTLPPTYTSGSICRQYSGLLNLSENCSTMRESIA